MTIVHLAAHSSRLTNVVNSERRWVDRVFVLNTADVVTTSSANMAEELIVAGERIVPDLNNLSLELLPRVLLELLKLFSLSPTLIEEHLAAELDGVTSLANVGDLLLGTVCDTRVGH